MKHEWLCEIHCDAGGGASACRSWWSPLDEIDSIAGPRILVHLGSARFALTFPRPQIDLKCTLGRSMVIVGETRFTNGSSVMCCYFYGTSLYQTPWGVTTVSN